MVTSTNCLHFFRTKNKFESQKKVLLHEPGAILVSKKLQGILYIIGKIISFRITFWVLTTLNRAPLGENHPPSHVQVREFNLTQKPSNNVTVKNNFFNTFLTMLSITLMV